MARSAGWGAERGCTHVLVSFGETPLVNRPLEVPLAALRGRAESLPGPRAKATPAHGPQTETLSARWYPLLRMAPVIALDGTGPSGRSDDVQSKWRSYPARARQEILTEKMTVR